MLTAIISAIKLWSIWGRLSAFFDAVAGWVSRNPLAALAAALGLAVAALLWLHHHDLADIAKARADQAQAEAALKTEQASNARLQAAITAQNTAVASLGAASAQAQAKGAKADADALTRSAKRAGEAQTIVVPPAVTGKPGCPTPADVMAVQGDL